QWRAPIPNGVENVITDSPSAQLVIDQLLVEALKFDTFVRIRVLDRLEGGRLNQHEMFERSRRRLHASIHLMSDRTALHEDDRMVTVLARDGCRQADCESGFGPAYYLLKAVRRQVMALVDNHMAVLGDAVIGHALSDETLKYADVDVSSRATPTTSDSTD